ncbi:MAG: molybdopterin-dependent oxidoreductase [Planctomycetales bacterium]|nr:molybdopterin-dependent oxidoreductase [Planctomycetales bacterium]
MSTHLNRRDVIRTSLLSSAGFLMWLSRSCPALAEAASDGDLVPFVDEPRTPPDRLDWETLDSWLTPQDQVFSVQHYGVPEFDYADCRLDIGGLVDKPRQLSLADIKALPKKEAVMTLECSGNGSNPGFMNAVYNSRWGGTPLAPLLAECGVDPRTTEVVFFGHDKQDETLRPGTNRELKVEVPFGRSMSLADAMRPDVLLAYERNGEPIEHRNGAPLRLIVPGWYGIANVKWLSRIECRDRRYMGRYMGRDYVTVRGERHGDEVVFVETSVTRINVKSVVARVLRQSTVDGKIPTSTFGAAWDDGTGIAKVEVRIDDGPWKAAKLAEEPHAKFGWTFFSTDPVPLAVGDHTVVSRAIDARGRIQPTADDDEIALKKTYWEAYQQWPRKFTLEESA